MDMLDRELAAQIAYPQVAGALRASSWFNARAMASWTRLPSSLTLVGSSQLFAGLAQVVEARHVPRGCG